MHVIDELKQRGFMAQFTHEEELYKALEEKPHTFYIGFDPTADSLTVGHFVTIMAMAHLQRAGHRPIALLGGGTTMIGDPSDKTDMRKVMTRETIDYNASRFKEQFSRFLDFSDNKAIMVNNADWLLDINYVDFLREVGIHFSVNKMLTAECYRRRLEDTDNGLTFFEFNYMLMQAYDFYYLNKNYDCSIQFGGNDQWSNMIAGVNLIDKKLEKQAYSATFNLLTTSDGVKMGKTMKGAVWLDINKTSSYELFQYFRNVSDLDAVKFLKLLTFLPLEEIKQYEHLDGVELNIVKERLAYEVCKLIHGQEEADKALQTTKSVFGGDRDDENMPTVNLTAEEIEAGIALTDVMIRAGLVKSKGEGRRLIEQNGVSLNEVKVSDVNYSLKADDFKDGKALLQKGKKLFYRLTY